MSIKNGASIILLVFILAALLALPANAAPSAAPPIPLNVHFETVVTGLNQPVFATNAGDGSGRLFIVERAGLIRIYKNGALLATPFLDVSSIITHTGSEQGLLGLVFAPDYATSGTFYISYTAMDISITLARYQVSVNPDVANFNSGQVLLSVPKPYANHNGGMLAFGPDHYLYMSTGDGGGGGDLANNAQNRASLLGKILRLDVSGGGPYKIPPTNPYFNNTSGFKEEIWSYGLRNAWRFSFDRQNGDLYIADVGQNTQEELDFQVNGASGGRNYGWRVMEGNLCFNPTNCTPPPNYVAPILVYNHGTNDSIGCAITGGYVFRGAGFPELTGTYLYGDYCTGNLWGAVRNSNNQWTNVLIADTNFVISSFGQAENGDVYIVDYTGRLLRITRAPIKVANFVSIPAQDGFILESSETSAVGGWLNSKSAVVIVGDDSRNRQYRSILSFNTYSLPDTSVIVSATLKLKKQSGAGTDPFSTHGLLAVDIRKPYFGSTPALQLADFAAAPGLNTVGVVGTVPVGGYYQSRFHPSAFAQVNKSGFTQLRLRFQTDDNNDLSADWLAFFSADVTVTAYRPVLQISYFIP
jgi:glucose/arabinose dehydrogenase